MLCSVRNVRYDLCPDLDCYGINGGRTGVDKKGLKGDWNALNIDGEVLMGKGEALKGDKYVLKGCREVSKSYHNILNWAMRHQVATKMH